MKSFEDSILRGIDSKKHRTHIEEAQAKAQEALKNRIDPKDFIDLYGSQNVRADMDALAEYERMFKINRGEPNQEEQENLSLIFEALVSEGISLHDWFGPNADTIQPSRYDDVFNGVDSVVEFQREEGASHLALAVDVTFNPAIEHKIEKIIHGIDGGELGRVRYFQSEHMNIRGELESVPKVVVGADRKTIEELAELWVTDRKALAEHPIQYKILDEILAQLSAFERYAEHKRQKGVATVYRRTRMIVENILKEKGITLDEKVFAGDKVFSAIKKYVEHIEHG